MSQHTEGPWRIEPDDQGGFGKDWKKILAGRNTHVVHAMSFDRSRDGWTEYYCGVQMSDADARLIAAAPELLAALENYIRVADRADDRECPAAVLAQARAAVAKAKGEA